MQFVRLEMDLLKKKKDLKHLQPYTVNMLYSL